MSMTSVRNSRNSSLDRFCNMLQSSSFITLQQEHLVKLGNVQVSLRSSVNYYRPERGANVVVFQNCTVVVEQSGVGPGHYVEIISGSRVLVVVNYGCHEGCEYFQVRQPVLEDVSSCIICVR